MTTDHGTADPRTQRERMLAGDEYDASDPELSAASRRARELQERYHRGSLSGEDAAEILAELIGELGEGVEVRPPLFVDYGTNISIGAGTFVNYNLTALDVTSIRIGAHCQIGPGVQLLTPTHPLDPARRRSGVEAGAPITLGDNVWLGGGVIVCPGVCIGEDSVIGAGSVVTRDIPPGVLAAGNPARVLRDL